MRISNRFWETVITLMSSLAIAALIYPVWPRLVGVVFICLVMALGIFSCCSEKLFAIPSKFIQRHMTLFFNLFIVLIGTLLFFIEHNELRLFYAFTAISGLFGLIYWFIDKRYIKKSRGEFIREECHILPAFIEITIAVFFIIEIIFRKSFSASSLIVILVCVIDSVSQFLQNRSLNGQTQQ